jgi:hypothetical protein
MEKSIIEKAGQLLSAETDEEIVEMINIIKDTPEQETIIDYIDGVNVWQKVEYEFNCKEFLEAIGYE